MLWKIAEMLRLYIWPLRWVVKAHVPEISLTDLKKLNKAFATQKEALSFHIIFPLRTVK
jgi:hypothetical protein